MTPPDLSSILDLPPPAATARLPYGPHPSQFGDLWLPAGRQAAGTVLFWHGGYWRARYDLSHTNVLCQALAEQGLAVWNMEYRRVGEIGGGWPGTFDDVLLAVAGLAGLAERFPIDLGRVVLCGHSAGGHLALWAGAQVTLGRVALPGLRGVTALAAVSDLHAAWQLHLSQDAVVGLLGGEPAAFAQRYQAASPTHLLPLGLPQVLVHGTADQDVPFQLSQRHVQRAVDLGDRARLVPVVGGDHFEVIDPRSTAWPVVYQTLKSMASGEE